MNNKSQIFLIDIDGIACEHAQAICNQVNREYNVKSKVEDVTTWDHNFGPITFTKAVEKYYHDENFILNMEVTPGFYEFLEQLKKIVIVRFATNRKKYCHNTTRSWIKNNFGGFKIYFAKRKKEIKFNYLVDDCPEEILSVTNKKRVCFLLSRPWNNNKNTKNKLKEYNQIHFVETFKDILNFFDSKKTEKWRQPKKCHPAKI